MKEMVYYVSCNGDPYHHYRYVCGPSSSGMYASCNVYPLDDGRILQPGAMRMVPERIFAGEIEVDPHEAGRVLAAVERDYPTH